MCRSNRYLRLLVMLVSMSAYSAGGAHAKENEHEKSVPDSKSPAETPAENGDDRKKKPTERRKEASGKDSAPDKDTGKGSKSPDEKPEPGRPKGGDPTYRG